MKKDPSRLDDCLANILHCADLIAQSVEGVDYRAFKSNVEKRAAVYLWIGIIGEDCNTIRKHHQAFAAAHPEMDLPYYRETRNELFHEYADVDVDSVWQAATVRVPPLRERVLAAIEERKRTRKKMS